MSHIVGHTLSDQELRAAGRFSVFLTAVRRVLDDIKQMRHSKRRWDRNGFGNDLASGACIQITQQTSILVVGNAFERLTGRCEDVNDDILTCAGRHIPSPVDDTEADVSLPVELGVFLILTYIGSRSLLPNITPVHMRRNMRGPRTIWHKSQRGEEIIITAQCYNLHAGCLL